MPGVREVVSGSRPNHTVDVCVEWRTKKRRPTLQEALDDLDLVYQRVRDRLVKELSDEPQG